MTVVNRVPDCADFSFDGMLYWFAELSSKNLLFHPDEDPADLISTDDERQLFSDKEVQRLKKILNKMQRLNGDKVYDAAYPAFMNRMGVQLDA